MLSFSVTACSSRLLVRTKHHEQYSKLRSRLHGGEKNLAKTLTGTLLAKAKLALPDGTEGSISWEETFELPSRYRRSIKGRVMGKDFSMEYAITNGLGWIRENGGEVRESKGEKLPLSGNWNAGLATLPSYLKDDVKLELAGKDKINGREAVGVRVSGKAVGGEVILFFDRKSGFFVKSKRRMRHPMLPTEVELEVVDSDYKEVSGVQFPHRTTSYVDGKKAIEMEITRIEFLKKVEDRLFEKP